VDKDGSLGTRDLSQGEVLNHLIKLFASCKNNPQLYTSLFPVGLVTGI
jgi:hypothetical protein